MAYIHGVLQSPLSFHIPSHFSHFFVPKQHSTLRFPSLQPCVPAQSVPQMVQQNDQRPEFKDFPYVSDPIKELMVDLASTVESRLESKLLPCTLPQEVQYFRNQTGTAHGSLLLRFGSPSSPIDLLLGSWLHCELPTGAALNITSLVSYMNDSTDAPMLLIEIIQRSPTSLIMVLDLPPRRELALHADYLKTYYEDTGLQKQSQLLYAIPEVKPYVSPSLYIRSVCSPTAALIQLDTTTSGGTDRLEEILKSTVSSATKEVLGIWLDVCVFGERQDIVDEDRVYLNKRDNVFKKQSIEIDIGTNLPRMFDPETADRIMGMLMGK